jgi:DNA-binding phage protein
MRPTTLPASPGPWVTSPGPRACRKLAKDAGLSRESLYRALSAEGNPSFATILKVTKALGVRLHAQAADTDA